MNDGIEEREVFVLGFSDFAFLALIILLYTFQNFFCKKFSLTYTGNPDDTTPVFTTIGGLVVLLVTFLFAGCKFSAQPVTIILGVLNAAALYFYNDFLLKGSLCGPYSVLTVFAVFGGITLPAAVKWIGFQEKMTGPAMCFVAVIMVAVYLMSCKPKDENTDAINKISPKFLLFCIGMFVCNGSYASILAMQQELSGEGEKEELIMITFGISAAVSVVKLVLGGNRQKNPFKMTGKAVANLLIYALSAAFAINSLVIIMLLDINVGVLLAVQNAGVMLLSVVFSYVFFKEKLTKMNVVGSIVMAIGLVGITVFERVEFSQIPEMFSKF